MLTVDFQSGEDPGFRVDRAVRMAHGALRRGGARYAVETLLNVIGVSCPPTDENYYVDALNYYLGLSYAYLNNPELAVDHLQRSDVWPSTGGNQLFESHLAESFLLVERFQAARARGLPTFLLSSMPRSGSASLTQSIAKMLEMPIVRISVGDLPNYYIVPKWLNRVSPGGAILHDHFGANEFNMKVLKGGGAQHVMVLVRDPRSAAFSLAAMSRPLSSDVHEAITLELFEHRVLPWLADWLAASESGELRVTWILSAQARSALSDTWRQICRMFVDDYPALVPYQEVAPEMVLANYEHGDDDRWRQMMSSAAQRQMWAAIPPQMAEMFHLLP